MGILLLLITFIASTYGFGLLGRDLGINFRTSVGTFEFDQIVLIIVLVICFFKKNRRKINFKDPILFPVIMLIIFTTFQFLRNIIEGLDLQLALRGIKNISTIFFIFPVVILIKNKSQLRVFINWILIIGFISALVSIYQFFSGTTFSASQARRFTEGFSRIYHPGAVLMVFCFFISLSHFLTIGIKKKYNWMYVLAPFYIIGMLTTLHRSLIGITLICSVIIIIIYLFYEGKFRLLWKPIIGGIIVILILNYFLQKSGFGVDRLFLRAESAIMEIKYFEGNYAFRWEFLNDTFSRIIKESPLIGVGFQDKSTNDRYTYNLTNDNTYNNILIMFGLSGIVLWLVIMYRIANTSYRNYKITSGLFEKSLCLVTLIMPLFFIVLGFFNALIIYAPNCVIWTTIIGLLYLIKLFNLQEQNNIKTNEIA